MVRIVQLFSKIPWVVALVFSALTIAAIWFGPAPKISASLIESLPPNHPAVERYRQFSRTYDAGNNIMITYQPAQLFSRESFATIRNITTNIEAISGIAGTTSLTSMQLPTVVAESVEFNRLVPEDDVSTLTDADIDSIKQKTLSNELIVGNLVSKDGSVAAIIAETKPNLSPSELRELIKAVNTEVDKVRTPGVEVNISSLMTIQSEIESSFAYYLKYFNLIALVLSFGWLYLTIGSLSLALIGSAFIAISALLTIKIYSFFGLPINLVTVALPALSLCVAAAIVTPIIIQFQKLATSSGLKVEAVASAFQARQKQISLVAILTSLIGASEYWCGYLNVTYLGLGTGIALAVTIFLGLTLLPAMLALIVSLGLRQKNERNQESIHTQVSALRLANKFAKSLCALILIAIAISATYLSQKTQCETSPIRLLGPNSQTGKVIKYVDENFGGPEIIDIEAVMTNKDQTFFNSHPLNKLQNLQKTFSQTFSPDVSGTISIANYFKELHKAFTPGISSEESMPTKDEDIKNYADLLELSDGKMLGRMLTLDRTKARLMIARRINGWNVTKVANFYDYEVPKITGREFEVSVAGLAGFANDLDKIGITTFPRLLYGFAALIALVTFMVSRSGLLAIAAGLITIIAQFIPMAWTCLYGPPLDTSTMSSYGTIALTCGVAIALIALNYRQPKTATGLSTRYRFWQAAVDSAPEIIATLPLLGLAYASMALTNVRSTANVGIYCLIGALVGTAILTILIPIFTKK